MLSSFFVCFFFFKKISENTKHFSKEFLFIFINVTLDLETVTDFIFLGPKITADGDWNQEIKTLAPWKKNYDQLR